MNIVRIASFASWWIGKQTQKDTQNLYIGAKKNTPIVKRLKSARKWLSEDNMDEILFTLFLLFTVLSVMSIKDQGVKE